LVALKLEPMSRQEHAAWISGWRGIRRGWAVNLSFAAPVASLFLHLRAGDSMGAFLDDFPGVTESKPDPFSTWRDDTCCKRCRISESAAGLIQDYFCGDAPSVHQMILRLEKSGYLARIPFQARSLRVLLPADQIPPLD